MMLALSNHRLSLKAVRAFHSHSPKLIKASDLLVKCLEKEGITHVFGVPGEENADFMLSLTRSKDITFVLTRHEQGAAFMAEAFGRLSGRPACCLATLGPGATNLITGVANANMDRAPMLVLTGQGTTMRQHKESHQIIDVVSMYRPVTKWATSILHPQTIPEVSAHDATVTDVFDFCGCDIMQVIRKAVRLARTEKPGAVLVELAENVAKSDVDEAATVPLEVRASRRPTPDDYAIHEACRMIRKAKRPIIIAGNGCVRTRASALLRSFCEATNIGVISTFMGKGAVDMDKEYCLFTIGLQAKDYTAIALEQSDLVITVGYDMVEYPPRLWNPTGKKPVICIDFEPAVVDVCYNPVVELVGDLGHSLEALRKCILMNVPEGKGVWDLAYQSKLREKMIEDFAYHKDDVSEGSIRPQKVLWDVRQELSRNAIVLSGVGAHKMWIGRHFHAHLPNTVLIPNGFCSMGAAFPGAIAASLVHPTTQVLAICGDGDFLMNVQEMETAKRLNSAITVMVWEDGGYGLISWKQETEYGTHTDLSFGNPKWQLLAESFGWHSEHVSRSEDLRAALKRCLEHNRLGNGPALLSIPIDYRENPLLTQRLGRISSTL